MIRANAPLAALAALLLLAGPVRAQEDAPSNVEGPDSGPPPQYPGSPGSDSGGMGMGGMGMGGGEEGGMGGMGGGGGRGSQLGGRPGGGLKQLKGRQGFTPSAPKKKKKAEAEEAPPPEPKAEEPPAPPADDGGLSGRGVKVGGEEPAPVLSRPIRAKIYKAAKDWEPLSLREGGDPGQASTSVRLKLVKVKGKLQGERVKASAQARLYKGPKDSRWLVVSLFPEPLAKKRLHLELRFRVFEGFVEEVVAAAVTVDRNAPPSSEKRDSFQLRDAGVDFTAERPGSGAVQLSALDPRPGKKAFNAGKLENAEFPNRDLGFVSLSWSVRGLPPLAP